jgi:hypothetical protein
MDIFSQWRGMDIATQWHRRFLQNSLTPVTPAKAEVQKTLQNLDSGFRRNLSCNGLRPVE